MTASTDKWPQSLWLVRHGESAGNVARDFAEREGSHEIAIEGRDIDVPLSDLGVRQSRALGRWLAERPERHPTVVLSSPYARARQTAELLLEESGLPRTRVGCLLDERLREKEFGSLNRFTKLGITSKFPHGALGIVLVLKGTETFVAAPDGQMLVNVAGNAGSREGG